MSQNKPSAVPTILFGGLLFYYFLTGNAWLTEKQKAVPSSPVAITQKVQIERESRERKEKAVKEGKKVSYDIDIGEDNFVSRNVGFVGSLPTKMMFWSRDMGRYPTKRVVKNIEDAVQDQDLHGLKIRIGHSEVFEDTARLFNDKEVVKRYPGWFRAIVGVPSTLIGETAAELLRSDYYNPIANTATCYSNIDGIALHEIGHAKDWARLNDDMPTIYTFARALPPVTWYQEWRASFNYAKQDLSKEKKYHVSRFLIPAFATYILAALKVFGKKKED